VLAPGWWLVELTFSVWEGVNLGFFKNDSLWYMLFMILRKAERQASPIPQCGRWQHSTTGSDAGSCGQQINAEVRCNNC
jgi:hypothetical protein